MKLQIQDVDGEILVEKEVVLSDNDKLVVKFNEFYSLADANDYLEWLSSRLEGNSKVIGVPYGIEMTVLKSK